MREGLTFGSLFAGIGGLDLGLERAGMRCAWQVEIDPFCRRVLAKHWPTVPQYEDVRHVGHESLSPVNVICGGFPCQDVSYAGGGAGIAEGTRSGLWFEYVRIIRELRPDYVLVENVAALFARGMGTVLGDLAGLRYDAEWSCLSACSMGAPHMRRRVFIVAHANGFNGRSWLRDSDARSDGSLQTIDRFASARARYRTRLENPSALYRDADGVPFGMERNRAIGNSVAPDVGEYVGRLIVDHHARSEAACP